MRIVIYLLMAFVLLQPIHVNAQNKSINGKITDKRTGFPVVGATISAKGSRERTISGTDGSFIISVPTSVNSLVISYIGYNDQEVTITGGVLLISLSESIGSLSEVVVTGVGVATSKKKLGVAVESISAEKLPAAPTSSVDQALVGKIPGALIASADGTPGARTNILLRGINTIQGGTGPMILVDGIQIFSTDLSQLDLNNVERLEVIQGAAAGTLYGAQGANGVIQVFTKKGKFGKPQISFSTNYSVGTYINSGDVAKASLHGFKTDADNNVVTIDGDIAQQDVDNTYFGQIVWNRTITDKTILVNKPYNKNLSYYDHFDQIFRPAGTSNANISVSGAGDKSDYSFAISNNYQQSAINKNGGVNRTNLSSNLGFEVAKGLKFRSLTQLIYTKNTMNPYYQAGRNSIYEFLNVSPFYDFNQTLEDGNYPYYLGTGSVSVNGYNPNFYFQYVDGLRNSYDLIQNFDLNYKVNKFLELDAKYGLNYATTDERWIVKDQSQNVNVDLNQEWVAPYGSTPNGEIDDFKNSFFFQNLIGTAFLRTDFKNDFNLNLPITTTTQASFDYRDREDRFYTAYGLDLPPYDIYNQEQTATRFIQTDDRVPFVTYGYLLNQSIDYGTLAGISGGFRTDYSSAFGAGSKPFTFFRANGYLNLADFNFWSSLRNSVPIFKLRSGYGEAGIQPLPFDRYITLSTPTLGNGLVFNIPSISSNPDLKVETTNEFEIGTEFSINLLKNNSWLNTLNGSFTYWSRTSADVIYPVGQAPSTGLSGVKDNAFTLGSKGYQFQLNLGVLSTKNLTWNFTTNWSNQRSEIKSTKDGQDIILTLSAGSTNLVLRPGDLVGQIYGYKAFTSLDQTREDGSLYIPKEEQGNYAISSDGYVVDTSYNRILFTNEATAFGSPWPKFNASFINDIRFKDFLVFNFQFDWIYGAKLYNQTKEWMYRDGIHADYQRPVTINGETGAYASYYQSAYSDYFGSINGARNGTKDYFYEDASFLRLRNVSVGFDFAKFSKLRGISKLQLVLTGRNILTITKYTGFDPEVSSGLTNSAFERGVDHNSMPNIKSYQVGLNVGF